MVGTVTENMDQEQLVVAHMSQLSYYILEIKNTPETSKTHLINPKSNQRKKIQIQAVLK